ncbi:unnamed protein product [Orchesella dallaii]|uniref:Uncharacterized protein n=1 Tax=Orchesella dallaii TaxID=48710 RepID=A0ABP1PTZ1_9HEXA
MARKFELNVQSDPDPPQDPNSGNPENDAGTGTTTPSSSPSVAAPSNHDNPKKEDEKEPPKKAETLEDTGLLLGPTETDDMVMELTGIANKSFVFRKLSGVVFGNSQRGQEERNSPFPPNPNGVRLTPGMGTIMATDESDSTPRTEPLRQPQITMTSSLLNALQFQSDPTRGIEARVFKKKPQEVIVKTQDMKGYVGGNEETYDIEKALAFVESKDKPPVTADNVKKGKSRNQRKRKKIQAAKKKQARAIRSQSVEIGHEEAIMMEGPSPPPAKRSELHDLAKKAGFKVNIQFDELNLEEEAEAGVNVKVKGKVDGDEKFEEKGDQENNPLREQPSNQEAARVKHILTGFMLPNDGNGTPLDFVEREAGEWMENRVKYLKRLARKGKVTSKFV